MAAFSVELAVPGKGTFKASFDVSSNGKRWSQLALGAEKLAGCHAYVTLFRGGLVRVDLRVSNGSVLPNGSGFCGKIYFDSLTVRAPRGLAVFTIPRLGESVNGGVYEVIKPLAGGQHHVLLPRCAFMRTFVLATSAQASAAMKVLNRDPIRIPNPIKNWGPLNSTFPTIDRAASDARFKTRVDSLRGAVASGSPLWIENYCHLEAPIGPYRLEGEGGGNNPGGEGIEMHQGDCQSRWALVFRETMAQLTIETRNYSAYHADTGEPLRNTDWSKPPHRQNIHIGGAQVREMRCFLSDDEGTYRTYNAQYEGTCPYEYGYWRNKQTLAKVAPPAGDAGWQVWEQFTAAHDYVSQLQDVRGYDVAHLIRGLRHLLCVGETVGDGIYREEAAMLEADAAYDWSNRPDDQQFQAPGEGYLHPSLRSFLYDAKQHPHIGHAYGDRQCAWMSYTKALMLKWFPTRADYKADADALIDFIVTAADQFGLVSKNWTNPWDTYFPVKGSQGVQAFHMSLLMSALYGLCMQRHGKITPDVLNVLERAYQTLYCTFGIRDAYGRPSSPKWILTERNANVDDPNSPWVHVKSTAEMWTSEEGDPMAGMTWHNGALLYKATGLQKYLDWPLKFWFPHATLKERLDWCKPQDYPNWAGEHWAVLEAHLQ